MVKNVRCDMQKINSGASTGKQICLSKNSHGLVPGETRNHHESTRWKLYYPKMWERPPHSRLKRMNSASSGSRIVTCAEQVLTKISDRTPVELPLNDKNPYRVSAHTRSKSRKRGLEFAELTFPCKRFKISSQESCKPHPVDDQQKSGDSSHDKILKERVVEALNLSKKSFNTSNDCEINPDMFMFGEEFEYWVPYSGYGEKFFSPLSDVILCWEKKLREKLNKMAIPDSEFSIKKRDGPKKFLKVRRQLYSAIRVEIGNWHCYGHQDGWDGKPLLEFAVSPYRLDQKFTINGKTYTPYELFDCFILSICNEIGLRFSSGHKHIDFSESVGGNAELLFRILVDVEDKAWLCSAFDTELYSSTSTTFVTQGRNPDQRVEALKRTVSQYNLLLREGYSNKKEDFHVSLPKITDLWECITGNISRFIPVRLPYPLLEEDNEIAKSGQIVSHPLNVTAEFRFLNTARDGNEVKLLNEFLLAWILCLNKKQADRTSVEYTDYNPDYPQAKNKTVKMMETFCTEELGLPPDLYKQILRI